jgi:hypothetical protein
VSKSKGKVNKSAIIRELYDAGKSVKEIVSKTKSSDALVRVVIRNYTKGKKDKPKNKVQFKSPRSRLINDLFQMKKAVDEVEKKATTDLVNHPPHYKSGGIETIDFIEAKDLNYRLGNVIKYVSRCGKKVDSDPLEDLRKARWYLDREIQVREQA